MMVSVIVPVYNHASYLRQRLDSILNQTYKDYELIILDDASTDNSREIIEEYARKTPGIITCLNEINSGSPFKQWNKGVSIAKGEFIWIAESDDYANTFFLEKSVSEISKSEDIGLVYCDTWVRNEVKGFSYRFSERRKSPDTTVKALTTKSFIENPIPNVSSVLFRSRIFKKVGLANEEMKFCGDLDLYFKVGRISEIHYLPEAFSTCRLHENSHYHDHYRSNIFLHEILKIYASVYKGTNDITVRMLLLKNIIVTIILRTIYFMKLPSFIVPEIPRRPKIVEYL